MLPFIFKEQREILDIEDYYLWYEKHTIEKLYYEPEEYLKEFSDEIKFTNISYLKILDEIDNGHIKPKELGLKM